MSSNVTEYDECRAFYQWAQYKPEIRGLLIKHVNEAKRTAKMGMMLNAIGMRKGLPDYQILVARGKYHSLWLEMKRRDEIGKAKRPSQVEWINRLNSAGHYAKFAYGWEDAARIVEDYLNNRLE